MLQRALTALQKIYLEESLEPGTLKRIGIKQGWNAVIGTENQCGMALNFTGPHSAGEGAGGNRVFHEELRSMVGRSLFDLAEKYVSHPDLNGRSIALAAMNALSAPLKSDEMMERRGVAGKAVDGDDVAGPGDVVTVIGYGGMVRSFLGRCGELHVSDLRPRSQFITTIIGEDIIEGPENVMFHGADENREIVPRSDVVMITGSTLVNGTFDGLMRLAADARWRALYGASAQLAPEILMKKGVNLVQNMRIVDGERFEYDVINEVNMERALKEHQEMTRGYLSIAPA